MEARGPPLLPDGKGVQILLERLLVVFRADRFAAHGVISEQAYLQVGCFMCMSWSEDRALWDTQVNRYKVRFWHIHPHHLLFVWKEALYPCIKATSNTVANQLVNEQGMADFVEGPEEVENKTTVSFLVAFLQLFSRLVNVAQELCLTRSSALEECCSGQMMLFFSKCNMMALVIMCPTSSQATKVSEMRRPCIFLLS